LQGPTFDDYVSSLLQLIKHFQLTMTPLSALLMSSRDHLMTSPSLLVLTLCTSLVTLPLVLQQTQIIKYHANSDEVWCYCREPENEVLIACDYLGCNIEWILMKCLRMEVGNYCTKCSIKFTLQCKNAIIKWYNRYTYTGIT